MWLIIKYFFCLLIEIIFPRFCVGCNKPFTLLCNKCFETLPFIEFSVINNSKFIDSTTICLNYTNITKKIIYEYKYKSVKMLGKLIGQIIYYSCDIPNCDYITYVPIHKQKRNVRGFNQTEIIAKQLGILLKIPVINILNKEKNTKSQMSLKNLQNRKQNLKTSITIKKLTKIQTNSLKQSKLLIVDDVYTTGSTLSKCAEVIKKNIDVEIHAICFAHKS